MRSGSIHGGSVIKTMDWRAHRWGTGGVGYAVLALALLLLGAIIALLLGGVLGKMGLYAVAALIVLTVMSILLITRQHAIAVTLVLAIHLYADWYLGLYFVALPLALALLFIFFLESREGDGKHRGDGREKGWVEPPALWLWGLFLAVTILPALRGAPDLFDRALYYPNVIAAALVFFWLGVLLARDGGSIRQLFKCLAALGALVALHTVVQEITGRTLLGTQQADAFLASKSFYALSGSSIQRVGSFFLDPNWDGAFLAMLLFMPLGLFVESSLFLEKILYFSEAGVILLALLFTFSIGAFVGAAGGFCAFLLLVGRFRHRLILVFLLIIAAVAVIRLFPTQIDLLLQHGSQANELSLRVGAWETAIRVIAAYPLAGVGFGLNSYGVSAEPYRVPAEFVALGHPHDSYLELAAMGGLPVLLLFLALLIFNVWLALRNWQAADVRSRSLLAGGIASVMALTANSISINGWTLPPLAAVGWLALGVCASPLLAKKVQGVKSAMGGKA